MFKDALLQFNIQVSTLAEQAQVSNDPKDMKILIKYLISGSKALRKAYKPEFTEILKEKKVLKKIEFISYLVNAEVETRVRDYSINDDGDILINFKESAPLKTKVVDIGQLVNDLLFVSPEDDIYYMMLGYFTIPENYQFIQIYNALTL